MAITSAAVNALFMLVYLNNPVIAEVSSQIHIKVTPGTDPNTVKSQIENVKSFTPLITLSKERLKKLSEVKPDLPDLGLWYRAEVKIPSSAPEEEARVKADLNAMDSITNVIFPKTPAPPSLTPDFVANQGYLRPNSVSNNGIDAEKSWTYSGGNGEGVKIYDIEYGWLQTHEDLDAASEFDLLLNPGDSPSNPFTDDHGTAVLGELIGNTNGLGVKGISYGASIGLAPERTIQLGSARANAIILAVNDGKAGDVILLEMQTWACGGDYGPAEEDQDVFDATVVAVANGITVVAAAGNGDVNLDSPSCGGRYDRDVRDSGAIIVGAGSSGVTGNPREKLWYSTFGSRVDVHGWGYDVMTTGYGASYTDPDNSSDRNKWYTGGFSGTSSASPIVAATAANIQGIALQEFGSPLDPLELRTLLTDSGLPQQGSGGNIGPLVNLGFAIDSLLIPSPPTTNPPTSPPTTNPPTPSPTICTGDDVTVELTTDTFPWETTWSVITKNEGRLVMQNDLLFSEQTHITTNCLNPGCYIFEIRDSFGDGICCSYGRGSFSVTQAGIELFAGGEFDDRASAEFCVGQCVDSPLNFALGSGRFGCPFIAENLQACARADLGISSHCPNTCSSCAEYGCEDSEASFKVGSIQIYCSQIPDDRKDEACEQDDISQTCRKTCDHCSSI